MMTLLRQSPNSDSNYWAKIVKIEEFTKHPNPKCERLKCCTVDGYSISVSTNTKEGLFIHFPINCKIEASFLSANNLYRENTLNVDKSKTGFFEDNGRVKIISLQGKHSEGFIIPLEALYTWMKVMSIDANVTNAVAGTEFDYLGEYKLCEKYISKQSRTPGQGGGKKSEQPKGFDRMIEDQFRFHYSTTILKKCPYVISPDSIISITEKVHGTSSISAKVLCAYPVGRISKVSIAVANCFMRLGRFFSLTKDNLFKINNQKYEEVWSSRSVIKNRYLNPDVKEGYYKSDIWGIAHQVLRDKLTNGMTIYYEIIGYLPGGGEIQKGYDYGCIATSPTDKTYEYLKNYDIRVYRITYTNPDGIVYEFSARQVQQWCVSNGVSPVKQYYYGYAKDLYPELSLTDHWHENFLERLCNDPNFYMEKYSPTCNNKVPHEGIVIRIEDGITGAFKVKCLKFIDRESKEIDEGVIDIETEA